MHRYNMWRTLGRVAALALIGLPGISSGSSRADYTLTINRGESRGTWEGWGCSLCWWANSLGGTSNRNLYADLFFSRKTVPYLGQNLPGLGLNIVRYNIGGGGINDNIGGTTENVPTGLPPYKDINGYWVNWYSQDPTSNSWDWTRDADQRAMLQAARARGVNQVEFFSNAPMWWMMDSKSSAGGSLQSWNRRDFARYIATVVQHAQTSWGIPVTGVEPFNEPSAGWWNYPQGQEGCNIPAAQQTEILGDLREELDSRGLTNTPITASDENSMSQGLSTWNGFLSVPVTVNGQSRTVASVVDKVAVHGYNGLDPWRDNGTRLSLRQAVGAKRLWMSEYGDNDGSGMALAESITEDLTYLQPTAWVYWQPVEPSSAWGFVNGNYGTGAKQPTWGAPAWVYTKYYVMAQFTRFLRPGDHILGNNDHNSIVAYNSTARRLTLITVNYGNPQTISYDLSSFRRLGMSATVTETNTNGSRLLQQTTVSTSGRRLRINAEANSIYSIVVNGVAP